MVDDLNSVLQASPPLLLYVVVAIAIIVSGLPLVAMVIVAEPVLMFATLLARQGHVSLWVLVVVSVTASVVGDALSYLVGNRWGRKGRTRRWLRKLPGPLDRAGTTMRRRGMVAVIIQRWFPPGRGFVPALAGAARMPFRRFLGFAAAAAVLWASINVVLVYFGGPRVLLVVLLLAAPFLIAGSIRRRTERRLASARVDST